MVARLLADGTQSEPARVVVKPKVTVTHGTPVPFLTVQYVVKVEPSTYGGTVTAVVVHKGVKVATVKAATRGGKAVLKVPLRGVDKFVVTLSLPAADDFGARTLESTVRAKGERVATGTSGARVRGLLNALTPAQDPRALRRHDVQLAVRRRGDGVPEGVSAAAHLRVRQRRLAQARRRQADQAAPRRPATHIEVDKGRQILMVVKNGAVYGLIAVSTGATGNTPEGSFHIQQKHPYTTSGYGGILFRTMGFIGDFAIHGYVAGAAVSGQPRVHPRADVGGRLDVQPVLGRRAAVRLPLRRDDGAGGGRKGRRPPRPRLSALWPPESRRRCRRPWPARRDRTRAWPLRGRTRGRTRSARPRAARSALRSSRSRPEARPA